MAKFPSYEQIAKNVAEKALDEYLIDGKTLREWIKIIAEQEPKTGHWTKDFTCSICGCKCYPMDIDFGDYNYCPNCGKRMKEGE